MAPAKLLKIVSFTSEDPVKLLVFSDFLFYFSSLPFYYLQKYPAQNLLGSSTDTVLKWKSIAGDNAASVVIQV